MLAKVDAFIKADEVSQFLIAEPYSTFDFIYKLSYKPWIDFLDEFGLKYNVNKVLGSTISHQLLTGTQEWEDWKFCKKYHFIFQVREDSVFKEKPMGYVSMASLLVGYKEYAARNWRRFKIWK